MSPQRKFINLPVRWAILILIISQALTACAQIEALLPPNSGRTSAEQAVVIPSETPSPQPPTPTRPSPTPGLSPTSTIPNTPRPTRTPLPTFTPSVTVPPVVRMGPDNFPDYVNPLTGYTAVNPFLLERRPMAVKIPLFPLSTLPHQSGLSLADHVFEYYLEDGLTRFIAIFYGNDAERVGPIRSARIFDEHIFKMYNAILVFNGADEERTLNFYEEEGLNDDLFVVERPGVSPLYRDNSLPRPNNLFGNTYEIAQYITDNGTDNSRQDLASNYFYSLGGHGVTTASQIYVKYSYTSYHYWDYDSLNHRYLRNQGIIELVGDQEEIYAPLTDSLNGQPIAADNVVILFVPHEFYFHSSDTEVFSINLVESGKAYVFRNGKADEAIWERTAENKPLSILTTGGAPYPLKPGVTFFQVISTTSEMSQEDQVWRFTFARPEE